MGWASSPTCQECRPFPRAWNQGGASTTCPGVPEREEWMSRPCAAWQPGSHFPVLTPWECHGCGMPLADGTALSLWTSPGVAPTLPSLLAPWDMLEHKGWAFTGRQCHPASSSLSPFVPTSPVTASWSCPAYLRRKPRSSSPKESSPRSCRRARSTCATPRSQSEASVCPSVLPGCPSLPEPSSRPSDTAQPQPGPSHCSTKPALPSLSPPHPLRTKPRVFSCLQG